MDWSYAIILDAGSSGTRLYMYRWRPSAGVPWPVDIEQLDSWKSGIGIADLVTHGGIEGLQGRVNDYLRPFVIRALRHWPAAVLQPILPPAVFTDVFPVAVLPAADFPADVPGGILPAAVPLSLYATAGVRQLDAGPRDQLMGFVNEYFEASIFAQAGHRTISGKEEALFGWLAASYLRNSIADGYVEMGGASAQIAFRVDPDALAGYDAAAAGTQVAEVVIGPFGSAMLLASYPLGSNEGRRRYDTRLANDAAFRDANGIILDGSKPNWFEGQIGGMVVHGASANNPRFVRMVNTVLDFFLPQDLPHPSIGDAPGEIVRTLNFVAGAGFFHSMQVAGNLPVIFQQHYNAMRAMKAEMTPAQMKYDPLFKVVWNRWVLQHVFRITTTDTAAVQLANHVDFLPFNGIEGLELSWTLGRLICVALGGAFPALVD